MSKRSLFSHITPLPPHVTRETAVKWLHNHREMIELNPLVIRHNRCDPAETAPKDEHDCHWYEMTDQINYLPGGLMKGEVTYKAAFHNLPNGLQTHVYAPAGLDLREKWLVCGSMPGEAREPVGLGQDVPRDGLYIREDVDMRCNFLLTNFVKKNLNKSHSVVVKRIAEKAAAEPYTPIEESQDMRSPALSIGPDQMSSRYQTAQQLPIRSNLNQTAEPRRELAACQCDGEHLPICSMYVEPVQDKNKGATFSTENPRAVQRDTKRVAYEPFNYVQLPSPDDDKNNELFSGNFHPLSHYHLLFNGEDMDDHAPAVPVKALAKVQAELPADSQDDGRTNWI